MKSIKSTLSLVTIISFLNFSIFAAEPLQPPPLQENQLNIVTLPIPCPLSQQKQEVKEIFDDNLSQPKEEPLRIELSLMPSEREAKNFIKDRGLDFISEGHEKSDHDVVPKIGLSIDGGGIRGLMPAKWLKMLEEELEKVDIKTPLYNVFDYVGGTSIGGILALGVAANLPTANLISFFKEEGHNIFPKHKKITYSVQYMDFFGLVRHWYNASSLEHLLQANFKEMSLKEAKTNVLVTACTTKGKPWTFTNGEEYGDYKIWEVARSTSAAPTFFEAYKPSLHGELQDFSLVDGGMWINNPSTLIAASLVKEYQGGSFNPQSISILSLGTGESPTKAIPDSAGMVHAKSFVDALMTSHSIGNHTMMTQLFGDNYFRINPTLENPIALNKVNQSVLETLESCANRQENREIIKAFVERNKEIIKDKLERNSSSYY
ncbi:patatin-like phospholipase family protein [Candidatus Paracaedibacter symbiosus]|uniref:patatin-like phospholipase family protein n=1 Tax=Candidatus Paracaedibacter symbiosus TaxID=244582 RepID=UPI0005099A2B|nr:patatin-like phospholipase family protein [Candidatus Paracaedibacter symbiosus]